MIYDIFTGLAQLYIKGSFACRTTFYFSIEDVKKTIVLDRETCSVNDGNTGENVDCVCKTTGDFFLKVWNEGYTPGLRDFMNGSIKSNSPQLLQAFMASFGK